MKHLLESRLKFSLIVVILFVLSTSSEVKADTYVPPVNATVKMYELISPNNDPERAGQPTTNPPTYCTESSTAYGCTAMEGDVNYPYPYGNENPVTISIENDYLLDVVSAEMGTIPFHATARHAQAIAARSYVYHKLRFDNNDSDPINDLDNSTNSQAFIPYRFERWERADGSIVVNESGNPNSPCFVFRRTLLPEQNNICDAVDASMNYVSDTRPNIQGADETDPARTEFFADIPDATLTNPSPGNPYPYLMSVEDPISSYPTIEQEGPGYGMSQRGASRWVYGAMGWRGDLDRWSVQWSHVRQILAHYYTGIHLRTPAGQIFTSDYRWNPLQIDWGTADNQPPLLEREISHSFPIQIQNTGVYDWSCQTEYYDFVLQYQWSHEDHTLWSSDEFSLCNLAIGETTTVNWNFAYIPDWGAGIYGLTFEIFAKGVNSGASFTFQDQELSWPRYALLVCVEDATACTDDQLFMPLIQIQGIGTGVYIPPDTAPPMADDDTGSTNEDEQVIIHVMNNDSDADGPIEVYTTSDPAHGATSITVDSEVVYWPNANYYGPDNFTYSITDMHGNSATATVQVTVAPVNDAPEAVDDLATVLPGDTVMIDALLNDSDVENDPLDIVEVSGDLKWGEAAIVPGSPTMVAYTAFAGTHGYELITYRVEDGQGGASEATITVTVNIPPVAEDDTGTTMENAAVDIDLFANDFDSDGDTFVLVTVEQPKFGQVMILPSGPGSAGMIRYTPESGVYGPMVFSYTIEDAYEGMATGTITIYVVPSGPPP